MASIPAIVYIIIGAFVSGFTKFVQSRVETAKLELFFWVGLAIILYGVLKLVFGLLKKQVKPQAKHPRARKARNQQSYRRPETPGAARQSGFENSHAPRTMRGKHDLKRADKKSQHPTIISCPSCNTKHYGYANYCIRCGSPIKK